MDHCPNMPSRFTNPREFDLFFGNSTLRWRCPVNGLWHLGKLYVSRETLERHWHRSSPCFGNSHRFSRCGKVLFSRRPGALEEGMGERLLEIAVLVGGEAREEVKALFGAGSGDVEEAGGL